MTTGKLALGITFGLFLFVAGCLTLIAISDPDIAGAFTGASWEYRDSVQVESYEITDTRIEGVLVNVSQERIRSVEVEAHLYADGVRLRRAYDEVHSIPPGERVRFTMRVYSHEGVDSVHIDDLWVKR